MKFVSGDYLNGQLRSIGFNIACLQTPLASDIEETLISASVETLHQKDNRLGGLLVDWLSLHYEKLNVGKITKFINNLPDNKFKYVVCFWCANAQRFLQKDIRFKKLASIYKGKQICLADVWQGSSQLKKNIITHMFLDIYGEDERFKNTCILVPKNFFPHRGEQIFSPHKLAQWHAGYQCRVIMGASYRADVWSCLQQDPSMSAHALAKKNHCSYRTAYSVKKDFMTLANVD